MTDEYISDDNEEETEFIFDYTDVDEEWEAPEAPFQWNDDEDDDDA